MRVNAGMIDRVLRATLGLGLLWLAFLSGLPIMDGAVLKYGAALVGVVMLIVAATGWCPVYTLLGIRTCRAT